MTISWVPPNDNGAAIVQYTLYGTREMDEQSKILYEGTDAHVLIGTPIPSRDRSKAGRHFPDRNNHNAVSPHRVRPGETIVFHLSATNFVGASVLSEPFSFRATDPPLPKSDEDENPHNSKTRQGESKSTSTSKTAVDNTHNTHTTKTRQQKTGVSKIMQSWREKARSRAAILEATSQQQHQQQQSQQQSHQQSHQQEWEMPMQPTRICQLPNGWIECWDPRTEHCYYHDPRTEVTQWEHPCPDLVRPTFTDQDLFLERNHSYPAAFSRADVRSSESKSPDFLPNGREFENISNRSVSENKRKRTRPAMPTRDQPFRQKRFKFLWHVRGTPAVGGKYIYTYLYILYTMNVSTSVNMTTLVLKIWR